MSENSQRNEWAVFCWPKFFGRIEESERRLLGF